MFKATNHATRGATILRFLFLLLLPLPAFGQAYPNPSPGTFTVDAPGSAQTQACLWNILGKRLTCAPVYGNGNGLSVEFSISAPPGVYFWRVGSLSGSIVTTGRAEQTAIRFRPFFPEQLLTPRFSESQTPTPPNVLLILADDMGYGDLQRYGQRWGVDTHELDRIGAEGITFTQMRTWPVCSPSRIALMTGRNPGSLGHNTCSQQSSKMFTARPLDESITTMADVFRDAGYATRIDGKLHLGTMIGDAHEYGFDEAFVQGVDLVPWIIPHEQATQAMADSAMDFIDRHPSQPWFEYFSLTLPHGPFFPTAAQLAELQYIGPQYLTHQWEGAAQVRFAAIREIAKQVNRLLGHLAGAGRLANTIVIFMSDNGPEVAAAPIRDASHMAVATGPFRGHKRTLYEGGARVPMMVRWPDGHIPAGLVDRDTPFSLIDVLPSVASLAGVAPPADIDGEDFSDAIMGTPTERDTPLVIVYPDRQFGKPCELSPARCIWSGQWKYCDNPAGLEARVELYDLDADPLEAHNLASVLPTDELAGLLESQLVQWPPITYHPAAGCAATCWNWP